MIGIKPRFIGLGLISICTVLTTVAQLSFKLGSSSISFSLPSFINSHIITGFVAYGLAAILFTIALKFGELSLLYPVWSLSFVWITLASMFFLNEGVSSLNWIGIGFIIAGISFIGFGARNG